MKPVLPIAQGGQWLTNLELRHLIGFAYYISGSRISQVNLVE
jgi:hypothetical protein